MKTFRTLAILIFLSFAFIHCNQGKKGAPDKRISNKNNSSVSIDTVVTEKEISMYNEPYKLKIIEYRLKDTASVSELAFQTPAQITLTKNNKTACTHPLSWV